MLFVELLAGSYRRSEPQNIAPKSCLTKVQVEQLKFSNQHKNFALRARDRIGDAANKGAMQPRVLWLLAVTCSNGLLGGRGWRTSDLRRRPPNNRGRLKNSKPKFIYEHVERVELEDVVLLEKVLLKS